MKCVIQGWQRHQTELYHWLLSRLGNSDDADDSIGIKVKNGGVFVIPFID